MKILAVHVTVLTLNFILFSETQQFLGHSFPSYLDIKVPISPLTDKINICCGYLFSELDHKESFDIHLIFDTLKFFG